MSNEERDRLIIENLNSGMSLSDLQKLLDSQYGIKMTYLDLRMLASTLQIQWEKQDKPRKTQAAPKQPEHKQEEIPAEEPTEDEYTEMPEDVPAEEGDAPATRVTLDDTPMPGSAMSGNVTFASGATGKWMMDRMGRMGLSEVDKDSGEPTPDDIRLFQEELQKVLRKKNEELQNAAFDGRTQVEISPVIRPGCDMNGTVTFASGAKGEWMIAGGQLDFDLEENSAKPTRDDMAYFQLVLTKKLREKGMA